MTNKIHISIPEPCHENWQDMTVVDKGRFCNSCQKTVVDFTIISDREIVNIFNKNSNLCGRFNATQLDRDIVKPKEKSTIWIAASTAIISFFTVGNQNSYGQGGLKVEQTDRNKIDKNAVSNNEDDIVVSGKILSTSQEVLETTVYIKIRGNNYEIKSDNGLFSIKLKKGEVVFFYSIEDEFEEKRIVFTESNDNYTVFLDKYALKREVHYLGGAISTSCVTITKATQTRTFFGRVFHKIDNWFR